MISTHRRCTPDLGASSAGPSRFVLLFAGLAASGLLLVASPAVRAQEEPLTLRINDGEAIPGGIAAVVFRTYSSRGIGQGQMCFGSQRQGPEGQEAGGGLFTELLGVRVFSANGDARFRARFDPVTQQADVQFGSLTAGINEVDGPLAVLYFRVSPSVQPDDRYDISLVPSDTFLRDGDGLPIPVSIRSGRLDIRFPGAPYETGAAAEDTVPGQVAFLGFETNEPFRIGAGQVVLELTSMAVRASVRSITSEPPPPSSTRRS